MRKLDKAFGQFLKKENPKLSKVYQQARNTKVLEEKEETFLLLELAPVLEAFLLELFSIQSSYLSIQKRLQEIEPLLLCQRQFVQRFASKKFTSDNVAHISQQEASTLIESLLGDSFSEVLFIEKVLAWMEDQEKYRIQLEKAALYSCWVLYTPQGQEKHKNSLLFRIPQKTDYAHLLKKIEKNSRTTISSAPSMRDGFSLTDLGPTLEKALSEATYCILCHNQNKDSCSKGLVEKTSSAFQKNPLGNVLSGCPLKEKISEMNTLIREGNLLGALAVVCVDNPLVAATGHRICNDCKKACIFQKQDPVDVPAIESSLLRNVLSLPFGFEIYSLLTRWNPLNFKNPLPRSSTNYKILIVGQGPAGFTLAQHLIQEGHKVVALDGLKIEPLPPQLTEKTLIRDTSILFSDLEDRQIAGFGGVMEYGITVRWDKNLLLLIRLLLERRAPHYTLLGSTRFGSQCTEKLAKELGFDHVALCTGAGRPHFLPLPHAFTKGVHFASDFLMSLQLSGAYKRTSPVPFLIQLPLVVIGGGLTACDAATETLAYYPRQVEKFLDWYEALLQKYSKNEIEKSWTDEELQTAQEFIEHAKATRLERQKAAQENRPPSFLPLLKKWGGVTLAYRGTIEESRAYRLNHEELQNALEEGIYFLENRTPHSIEKEENGWIKGITFQTDAKPSFFPARTLLWAVGTDPNTALFRHKEISIPLEDSAYLPSFLKSPSSVLVEKNPFYSILGDLHPTFSGSVVKAMASATYGASEISEYLKKQPPCSQEKPKAFSTRIQKLFTTQVIKIRPIAPNTLEICVKSPAAAKAFQPGQFFRVQKYASSEYSYDTKGIALTGIHVNPQKGTLSFIVLQTGASSLLCKNLKKGEILSLMGPTGSPTEIPSNQNVVLIGGGFGNAVLFTIGQAMREKGCHVLFIAAYRNPSLVFKKHEIEEAADQVIWCFEKKDKKFSIRSQDICIEGKLQKILETLSNNSFSSVIFSPSSTQRILTIGAGGMMQSIRDFLQSSSGKAFSSCSTKIAGINSPMQCMMKEICGRCLQRHQDPVTGLESFIFSCAQQDQSLNKIDFSFLQDRYHLNSLLDMNNTELRTGK